MMDQEHVVESVSFNDRKVWLVIFGVLEILFGGLCVLMALFVVLGVVMSSQMAHKGGAHMDIRMMIPGMMFYLLFAVWFISMGIGSIGAKRWARALWLVSAWIWLIVGVVGLINMLLFMPGMYNKMGSTGQIPQETVFIIKIFMFAVLSVLYLLMPSLLILFYGNRHVKATCEYRDPKTRWTDRCPLPVLALCLVNAYCVITIPLTGFYGWMIPVFGTLVTGTAGACLALIITVLFGYIAWGMYKLRIEAWWCLVVLIILGGTSAMITFSQVSFLDMYEQMNFPEQQLEIMRQLEIPQGPMVALLGLTMIGYLGYVLYVRKYFYPDKQ